MSQGALTCREEWWLSHFFLGRNSIFREPLQEGKMASHMLPFVHGRVYKDRGRR